MEWTTTPSVSDQSVREIRQLCMVFQGTQLSSFLNGLDFAVTRHREIGMDQQSLDDYAKFAKQAWIAFNARGREAFFEYANGYAKGRWGHGMEYNPNPMATRKWDYWNDGWRMGHLDMESVADEIARGE